VRREGHALRSTFVALWEPYRQTPFLADVTPLPNLPVGVLGYQLHAEEQTTTVLYQPPESRTTVTTDVLFSMFCGERHRFHSDAI